MAENSKNEIIADETSDVQSAVKKNKKTSSANKKPNIFARIGRWFREMRSELKKVQWPTVKQTLNQTGTVIVCVIVVGVFIWVFDWLAAGGAKALIALAQG